MKSFKYMSSRIYAYLFCSLLMCSLFYCCKKVKDYRNNEDITAHNLTLDKKNKISVTDSNATFYTGGDDYDTNGNLVNAVEGGIIKVDNLYYLWGMDRSDNNYRFKAVNLYSSPDLKTWTFVNSILNNNSHPDLGIGNVVERPKLLHNTNTGKFVLWVHYEGKTPYRTSEVGYATCNSIGGDYTWQAHYRPLGLDSKDMNVFKDTDGKAYMISSVANNSQVVIMELNSDYTGHLREVYRGSGANSSSGFGCEGHAMIKSGGTYYLIESMCSGWDTNDNRYYTATSLAGPWTQRGLIASSGAKTYQSQVTNAFPVSGSAGTSFIYVGDRWSTNNYSMTRLVILPLKITGTSLSMPWYDQWSVNVNTGSWSPSPTVSFNGKYKIVNRNSGKVLDVPYSSTEDKQGLDQHVWNGENNQRWTIFNLGRGEFRIVNVNSNKSLDNPGSSRAVGTNVIQYSSNNNFSQKWHIIPCKDGYFRLISVNTLGKALGIDGASQNDGAGVVLSSFKYADDQQWKFVPVQ